MGGRGGHINYQLADLLPHSFGPLDLTHDIAQPLMLEPRDNALELPLNAAADLNASRCLVPLTPHVGSGGAAGNRGHHDANATNADARHGGQREGEGDDDGGGSSSISLPLDGSSSTSGAPLGEMLTAALREANLAYAPYSRSPAGLALCTSSGRVFSGRCVESAAYNPTMSPLHAALVAGGGKGRYSLQNTHAHYSPHTLFHS